KCAPASRILAVVKANAYGHGLARALRGFADADGLGLIEPEGAIELRQLGWTRRIVLLEGFFDEADLQTVIDFELDTVVHSLAQLDMLEKLQPGRQDVQIDVHLKV